MRKATLILDFTPNAVHAGIYRALAAGYYRAAGHRPAGGAAERDERNAEADRRRQGAVRARRRQRRGGADRRRRDARAVMAIVQRPLGGLIALASEHLRSPAQLQGKTVGITGVPSDTAVLDTEVRHAGGDPARVHVVTIGFNGAQALAGREDRGVHGLHPRRRRAAAGERPPDHGVRAGPRTAAPRIRAWWRSRRVG